MSCLKNFWVAGNYIATYKIPVDTVNPEAPITNQATITKLTYDGVIFKGYQLQVPFYYGPYIPPAGDFDEESDTLTYYKDFTLQYQSGGQYGTQWGKWQKKGDKISTSFWGSGPEGTKIIMKVVVQKLQSGYRIVTYFKERLNCKWTLTNDLTLSKPLLGGGSAPEELTTNTKSGNGFFGLF